MGEELIDHDAQLHVLRIRYDAPGVLTSGAATSPVEDFALLYRMSTGIYGRPGLRRFNQPFSYARPYLTTLHFGSPYLIETVVPTLLIVGGIKGLPSLLGLVKQVILLPGEVGRGLKENKAAKLKAEEEIIEREARLEAPERIRELARARREADFAEAHERALRSRAAALALLDGLDPTDREAVQARYGENGIVALGDVARRAEASPVRPRELSISPVEDADEYPEAPSSDEVQSPST